MEEKKRAWTYCRIDAPEDQHGCLKGQRKELLDYAEQMGFEVVGESQDTGSGLNFDRNGLTEVMETAEKGEMDVLQVVNVSRLGRDGEKTLDLLCGLAQLDVEVYSPLEGEIQYSEYENLYHGIAAMKFE